MVELFIRDAENTADRNNLQSLNDMLRGGNLGIIESSGDLWREQRRFTLKTLRNFGLSKSKMEDRVVEELETICERIDVENNQEGREIDFHQYTDIATGSVINSVVCGYRFSADVCLFFEQKSCHKSED